MDSYPLGPLDHLIAQLRATADHLESLQALQPPTYAPAATSDAQRELAQITNQAMQMWSSFIERTLAAQLTQAPGLPYQPPLTNVQTPVNPFGAVGVPAASPHGWPHPAPDPAPFPQATPVTAIAPGPSLTNQIEPTVPEPPPAGPAAERGGVEHRPRPRPRGHGPLVGKSPPAKAEAMMYDPSKTGGTDWKFGGVAKQTLGFRAAADLERALRPGRQVIAFPAADDDEDDD